MQVLQFIFRHKKQVAVLSIFIGLNVGIIGNLKLRKEMSDKYQEIKNKQILSIKQAFQMAKKNNTFSSKSQQFLIKVQPVEAELEKKVTLRKDLTSNQFWYIEPSLNNIASQITNLLNKCFVDRDERALKKLQQQNLEYNLKWTIKIQAQKKPSTRKINNLKWTVKSWAQKKPSTQQINGFGRIVGSDLFQVDYKHVLYPNKGFLSGLYENVAYFLEALFFFKYTHQNDRGRQMLSLNQNRSPVISGPIIGHITYFLSIFSNRSLLLHAKIEDQNIVPLMLSSSRQKMLKYFSDQMIHLNLKLFGLVLASIFFYQFGSNTLKKRFRQMKNKTKQLLKGKSLKILASTQFRPSPEFLAQDKLCIICYTSCRNVIFFNCRHFIICDQCKQSYQHVKCPLCKEQVEDQKILHQFA